jgi:uncharacterized membrane protein
MPFPTPSGFVSQTALAASLLVVPLVILYLLKPKPKRIRFPTIMFIKKIEEARIFSSLLNRFVRDPLLLLQAIIITLLAVALANPYFLTVKTEVVSEEVAIVIDGSASMKATDVKSTRFDAAIGKARDIVNALSVDSRVSIVIAENIPIAVLSGGSPNRAVYLLDKLECGETPSNTGDALMLAKDLISQSELRKRAYVISDFSKAEGDLKTSVRILKLNGIDVGLVKVNAEGSNVGIVDVEAKRTPMDKSALFMTYTVRNFDYVEHEVTGRTYVNDVIAETSKKKIQPLSEWLFYVNSSVSSDRNWITVVLDGGGTLGVDDRAYSIIPGLRTYRTILLTSGDSDRYVSYAIESQLNNLLRTAEPPVIPTLDDYDVIVIGSVKGESILPGTFRDIKRSIENGKSLIIIASDELAGIKDASLEEVMPVTLGEKVESDRNAEATEHDILKDVSLENTVLKKHYAAEAKPNATVIAETDGSPLIAYWDVGKGRAAYVGINPSPAWSNMQYSSSFPIFWSQLIDYLSQDRGEIKNVNLKTGQYLVLGEESDVTTPSGNTVKTRSLFLDRQGFYKIKSGGSEEAVAVNLEDEDESDIKTSTYQEEAAQPTQERERIIREELLMYIITLVTLVMLIEMLVYRRRGKI